MKYVILHIPTGLFYSKLDGGAYEETVCSVFKSLNNAKKFNYKLQAEMNIANILFYKNIAIETNPHGSNWYDIFTCIENVYENEFEIIEIQ